MTDQPWISLDKHWDVECRDCGLLDSQPTKERAIIAAQKHRDTYHAGKARIGGSWATNNERDQTRVAPR